MDWFDAEAYCVSQGAHLMKINDDEQFNLLYNYYVNNAGGAYIWVKYSLFIM